MTDDTLKLPDINGAKRESIRVFIDFYIRNKVQKTDDQGAIDAAFNDVAQAISAPDTASMSIEKLMETLREINTPPRILNDYLDRIANDLNMPDTVVDAAIEYQDKLIKENPELKAKLDELQEEFSYLMIDPQPD